MFGYVIGDGDMITGFRTVGIEGSEVNSIEEASQALNKALARNDLGNHNCKRGILHQTTNSGNYRKNSH